MPLAGTRNALTLFARLAVSIAAFASAGAAAADPVGSPPAVTSAPVVPSLTPPSFNSPPPAVTPAVPRVTPGVPNLFPDTPTRPRARRCRIFYERDFFGELQRVRRCR